MEPPRLAGPPYWRVGCCAECANRAHHRGPFVKPRWQSSITTVKADVAWPTLTEDKSDARDVVMFYEEFEDVCALANNCMSARERLLALRAAAKVPG